MRTFFDNFENCENLCEMQKNEMKKAFAGKKVPKCVLNDFFFKYHL